eukprot:3539796-Amphidinium_carterae.1
MEEVASGAGEEVVAVSKPVHEQPQGDGSREDVKKGEGGDPQPDGSSANQVKRKLMPVSGWWQRS